MIGLLAAQVLNRIHHMRHGDPYIHWDWVTGIGSVAPISGGSGDMLAGPEAGTIITDPTTGDMTYTALAGGYIGPVTPGSSVSPTDPRIPDC